MKKVSTCLGLARNQVFPVNLDLFGHHLLEEFGVPDFDIESGPLGEEPHDQVEEGQLHEGRLKDRRQQRHLTSDLGIVALPTDTTMTSPDVAPITLASAL